MTDALQVYDGAAPIADQRTLKALIGSASVLKSLAEVAAQHVTPERVTKMVLLAASRQPKLFDCSQESIIKAAMTAAELALDCSGSLGRASLVPHWNNKLDPPRLEALFWPQYLGLMDLARRSGEILSMDSDVIYKGDHFVLKKGITDTFEYERDLGGEENDDDIIGAYFIARFVNGGHHIEYMSRKSIEAIRRRSKSPNAGAWKTDYAAMCKKTVIKRGLKFCPLSIEVQQNIAKADEDTFDAAAFDLAPNSTPEPERGTLKLEDLKPGRPEDHVDVAAVPGKAEKTSQSIIPDDEAAEYKLEAVASTVLPDDLVTDQGRWRVCRTLILKALKVESPADVTEEAWAMLPKFLESNAFKKELVAENLLPKAR